MALPAYKTTGAFAVYLDVKPANCLFVRLSFLWMTMVKVKVGVGGGWWGVGGEGVGRHR